jgi:hypothetical protein
MLCKAIHLGAEISFAYYCNEVGLSDGDGSRPGAEAARAGRPGHPPPTKMWGSATKHHRYVASIASGARYSLRTEMKG